MRYEATYGPNTKQWWIYDNEKDVYIDPPLEVLEETNKHGNYDTAEGMDTMRDYLEEEAEEKPIWLYEVDYHYPADLFDI